MYNRFFTFSRPPWRARVLLVMNQPSRFMRNRLFTFSRPPWRARVLLMMKQPTSLMRNRPFTFSRRVYSARAVSDETANSLYAQQAFHI